MRDHGFGMATSLDAHDAEAWMAAARAGRFAEAWRASDRIRARTTAFGDPAQPRHLQQIWTGASPFGRRVLVRCYHGLGDTLQFVRYLPYLRALASRVTVWTQPSLLTLLQRQPWDVSYLGLHDGAPGVPFDMDLEVMELPYLFRSTLRTLPRQVPYLVVPQAPRPSSPRPRVGIVWRAGAWDARRSIPFELLRPLLDRDDITWCGLQLAPLAHEHHPNLKQMGSPDALASARIMRTLDLVISVDTMTAHLAGALGLPVWTLVPDPADWRWLTGRHDSPWYPTMRLFRQSKAGDWFSVVADVQRALAQPVQKPCGACGEA